MTRALRLRQARRRAARSTGDVSKTKGDDTTDDGHHTATDNDGISTASEHTDHTTDGDGISTASEDEKTDHDTTDDERI